MKTVRRKLTMTYEKIDDRGYTDTHQTIRTSEYTDGLDLGEMFESFVAFIVGVGYDKEDIYYALEYDFKLWLENQ